MRAVGGDEIDTLLSCEREVLPAIPGRERCSAQVRARRVQAQSLAADWDALVAMAGAPHEVTALGNGEV